MGSSLRIEDLPRYEDSFFTHLNISVNHFAGPLDLEHMPPKMTYFTVFSNRFSGTLNLSNLPKSLDTLYLNKNRFVGDVDLTELPPSLGTLNLSYNSLEQDGLVINADITGNREVIVDAYKFGSVKLTDGRVPSIRPKGR
eukprot:CAMPEP_0201510840 /NCGR_PEP_ID=MMETSP0161_2-20130828/3392_1 /ASSEMBLY_ACC=CAM_ASM_000251 /TAXON_ID=180227 /ORGANISM="Neoparamoeba aestuarina, Strain SoJaBio B1-5/56/2" /LENGTH=139 /DNA_ID=CAMNT_0047906093 /DNA_START=587 /DNA_END=1002 /DNA_ORIENTATION=-